MAAYNQSSVLMGVAVGCTAGLAAYLAVSSSSASVLAVAPVNTGVQVTSAPIVAQRYNQAAVEADAAAVIPADVQSATKFEISAPVQAQSWGAAFIGMLAVPLAAFGFMMVKQQNKREERQALVSIDDLLSVGKKAAVASAVVGASAGFVDVAGAYPIFAQQGYENPREATGRIVCANCHLAEKKTEIELPQAVLPDQVFEAVTKIPFAGAATLSSPMEQSSVVGSVTFAGAQPVEFVQESGIPVSQALVDIDAPSTANTVFKATIKVPYDLSVQQVGAKGKPADLNVGAVLVLPEGFRLAPEDRIPESMKEELNGLKFIQYSEAQPNILVVGPVPGKMYNEMHVALLSPDPRVDKKAEFGTQPVYVGGNRGRGQIYPTGEKSNNNIYNVEHAGKIVDIQLNEKKRIYTVSIDSNGTVENEVLPPGAELLVKIGDSVEVGQAITTNPNVGGFGQAESEIVLQDPGRVQALLFFCATVLGTQTMLVVKKKQYEQVQLSEMNF